MTPTEYRTALARLSWSQRRAARFFCRDERTSRAWADPRGNGPPPEVAMWLHFMLTTGITPDEVDLILSGTFGRPDQAPRADPICTQDAETKSSG